MRQLILGLAFTLAAHSATAGPILDITGVLNPVSIAASQALPGLAAGTLFSATIRFDDPTTPTAVSVWHTQLHLGEYLVNGFGTFLPSYIFNGATIETIGSSGVNLPAFVASDLFRFELDAAGTGGFFALTGLNADPKACCFGDWAVTGTIKSVSQTPEPFSLALLAVGAPCLAVARRRFRRR